MKITIPTKRGMLVAVASLVLAFTRTYLQYKRYGWLSLTNFVGSWFVHYIAVYLLSLCAWGAYNKRRKTFLEDLPHRNELDKEQVSVFVSLLVIISSISVLFIAHFPHMDDDLGLDF